MDSDRVLTFLQDVAADIITPNFRSLATDQVFEKGPGDLVTVADRAAEVELTRRLREAFPAAIVVGEEAASADATLLDGLDSMEQLFLVDPIDGTRNFVNGHIDHAVMVAEVRRGETVRSWIWQPQHERAYVAERGAGLWCNGERIHRPEPSSDPQEWVGVATRRVLLERPADDRLPKITEAAWCCGVDYPRLASGETDFVVYRGTQPWDHVPGVLMVTETGGVARQLNGATYTINSRGGGLMSAASAEMWDHIHQAIFDGKHSLTVDTL